MGFAEESHDQVRAQITVDAETMTSRANGRTFRHGRLELPTLGELRERVRSVTVPSSKSTLGEVVADAQQLHTDERSAGGLFQVASQFNLLEMRGPAVTPEEGVGIYEHDRTQGPACAIAAGAGTIYRNYFAEVKGRVGQTADNQFDCLAELGAVLGNSQGRLWKMQNGYALPTRSGLEEVSQRLRAADESELDHLRQLLRIGIHWDTQVTLGECAHTVTQAYCSALPVGYCRKSDPHWTEFARLVLEATYEATFCAAVLNAQATGNQRLFLTLVGGGAFENHPQWIFDAIARAWRMHEHSGLQLHVVSYRDSNSLVGQLVEGLT